MPRANFLPQRVVRPSLQSRRRDLSLGDHVIQPQTKLDGLEASKSDCQTLARSTKLIPAQGGFKCDAHEFDARLTYSNRTQHTPGAHADVDDADGD